MKVKDLIKELGKLDPKAEVILSSDAEGNTYRSLAEAGVSNFTKEGYGWESAYEDDDEKGKPIYTSGSKPCVVLYPV